MEEIKQGYKQTDIGVIPEDWEVELIGNLFVFKNGLNKAREFFGYGTPIVNYMDVYSKDSLNSSDIQGKVCLSNSEIQRYEVKAGDVFFTRTSETPEEVGISSVVLDCCKNTVFSGFVLRGRPINNKLTNEFKSFCFKTKNVRNSIIQGCTYTTRALTNGTQLSKILIPIPLPKEQTAIATALSDTDALIAALDKKIAKKQQIKQGAMQQLLTGKKRLSGFSGEWVEKKICEVGKVITGSTPSRSNPDLWNGNFVWVSAQDLKSKYIVDSVEKITEDGKNTCRVLPPNSVLVTCIASIGLNALSKMACATNQQINSVVCNSDNEPEFLYYQINNNVENLKMIAGQTAVPIINKGQFENFTLMFPNTKPEQTAIATILTDMDNEIAQLEKERDKYKELKAGMMQVLLTGKIRLI